MKFESIELCGFDLDHLKIGHISNPARKPLINEKGYPYHEARLVDFQGSPSKLWFIIFYVWDIGLEKLVRKRVGKKELNKIRDLNERRIEAQELILEINRVLKGGGYAQSKKKQQEVKDFDFHGYKLLNALDFVVNRKREIEGKKKGTIKQFAYTKRVIERFMINEGIDRNFLLRNLNKAFAQRLTMYLKKNDDEKKAVSNKTHNGIITIFHTAIETLRELDASLFATNPIAVKKLNVVKNTHAAYTLYQLTEFSKVITDKQLLLFIRMIYFTLSRPKELSFLKVGHIQMEFRQMLIAGDEAKTCVEKYVGINNELAKVIEESGILNYPHEYFVFTSEGKPGQVKVGVNYFTKRFRTYLNDLGFKKINSRYTLYSFKHSGAIQLYRKTKDISIVQRQCRHADP
jgi:integrase